MHELSLVCAIVEGIEERAAQDGFTQVSRVVLEVGHLCCVAVESLMFCLELITPGTIVEGASFEVRTVPGVGRCRRCGHTCAVVSRLDPCPACGMYEMSIAGGDQLLISQLEVS